MEERAAHRPHGLTATATHDTKRGEDARARLLALSGARRRVDAKRAAMAGAQCRSDRRIGSDHGYPRRRTNTCSIRRCSAPGRSPASTRAFVERIKAYAIKAAREGKQETSWLAPDERYEAGLASFVDRASRSEPFGTLHRLLRCVRAPRRLDGRAEQPCASDAEDDDAGRARFLSGHRILGSVAGRSRQSATRRLRGAGIRAGIRSARRRIGARSPAHGRTAGSSSR